ncbi:DUF4253 domain-containing protein [Psychroserpens sp. MEBiC05023]
MKKIFYYIMLITTLSCLNKTDSTIDVAYKNSNVNGLNINSELLSNIINDIKEEPIKLNREVWTYDREGNEQHYFLDKGLIFKFVNEEKAHSIFNKYYKNITKGNNYLFLTNMQFDKSYKTYYDIVIIDGADPFKLIEQIGTNGVNYDIYNPDIIKQLKEWDEQVNFKLVVIDDSRIHAYMTKLPNDINTFTSEVYEFCPDVIDQGYSSMEDMILDYKTNQYFWLWWD